MKLCRSSITKKILGLIIIVGCSGVFLNGYVGVGESVYAQGNTAGNTTQGVGAIDPMDKTTESGGGMDNMTLWQIMDLLLKIIYIFLWPLLVVAGLSLDNTLVYASVFHMDAPLWKFWNMMKNFANFTLGFMVLFAIIKSIMSNSGEGSAKDAKSPLGIIKKTLIAGVLIQASWFLMAVLVDLSTIATYAVGGLPLNIIKNDHIGKMQIITVNSTINLDNFSLSSAGGKGFNVWYTLKYKDKEMKISPCRIEGPFTGSFVIGRVKGGTGYRHLENFNGTAYSGHELCVLYGNKIVMRQENAFMEDINKYSSGSNSGWYESKENYDDTLGLLLKNTGRQDLDYVQKYAVKVGGYATGSTSGFALGKEFLKDTGTVTMQLSQLIDKSKGFVGPLVTIYSSLLNFAQLTDTDITSIGETSGVFIIKTGVALALFFPLIALAVVLIARIGLLWLFIVASPFIVLAESFSLPLDKLGKAGKFLSINGVMGIVFAPVISVAALSLSLIFLTALLNGFSSSPNDSEQFAQTFNVEKITSIDKEHTDNDAYSFGGAANIEMSKLPRGDEALDRFSWLLVNFFAIGLMWMIVFAAIKANKLGETIGKKVQDFGGNVFQTLPIIPIPGTDKKVGIGSMAKVLYDAPERKISDMKQTDDSTVSEFLYGKPVKPLTEAQASGIFTEGATQASIEAQIIEKTGVKKDKVADVISGSIPIIGATIRELPPIQQQAIVEAVASASGGSLSNDRYRTRLKEDVKNELDKISSGLANEAAVKTLFENPSVENKPKLTAYFAAGLSEYSVTTTDAKTYTITKNTSDDDTYTVTEKTTPPIPTT